MIPPATLLTSFGNFYKSYENSTRCRMATDRLFCQNCAQKNNNHEKYSRFYPPIRQIMFGTRLEIPLVTKRAISASFFLREPIINKRNRVMKKLITTLTALTAVTAFNTYAQSPDENLNESGIYVGGNYGYLRVEGEDEFDDDKDVWQGVLGYKFNSYIALEGSYIDFGDYGNNVAGASTDGYTAALKGIVPIVGGLSAYAKLGQLWSETDYRLAGATTTEDDESVFVGAGLSFAVTPQFLINAEYVVYDTELDADQVADDLEDTNFETDLKQASLGVEYRF